MKFALVCVCAGFFFSLFVFPYILTKWRKLEERILEGKCLEGEIL